MLIEDSVDRPVVTIWVRIFRGEFLNRIAADYDVNPGRVAEIKMERRFIGSREAAIRRKSA